MVLLACLWKAAVAWTVVVPLVVASKKNVTLPSLLDATIDELAAGLKCGSFSSVDLVDVSKNTQSFTVELLPLAKDCHSRLTLEGICRAHSTSQFFLAYGYGNQSRCLGHRQRARRGESCWQM
jgi:hypothetical protein